LPPSRGRYGSIRLTLCRCSLSARLGRETGMGLSQDSLGAPLRASSQKSAKAEQQEAGPQQAQVPEELAGLIPRMGAQRALRGAIQQIEKPDVILLREVVQRPPDQPVEVQLAPQGCELPPRPAVQDRLGDAQRAAKSCDDPTDRRHFHLAGRVADQID